MDAPQQIPAPALQLRNVVKRYGGTLAVRDVSLSVEQGEFFSLLGPSGSGKTTLLRVIGGFEAPSEGEIRLAGQRVEQLPPNKRRVNTVFQNYALFPHMSVFDNVAFGLRMRRAPRPEIQSAVSDAMRLVQLDPRQFADRRPARLSGGEQQRVALARALVNKPGLLLLDEPLAALDKQLRTHMQRELRALQRQTGITFLYVTHDQEEALSLSDRVAVMNRGDAQNPGGHIEQVGRPGDVYDRPATRFVCQFIGRSNILQGSLERMTGGYCEVRCGDLLLTVACREPQGRADGAWFLIRPEKLRIEPCSSAVSHAALAGEHAPGPGGWPNRWQGVVVSRALYGDTVGYSVAVNSTVLEVKAANTRAHIFEENEQVQIGCDPSDVVAIEN